MKRIAVVLMFALASLAAQPQVSEREMAITVDDLPGVSAVDSSVAHVERLTTGLLDTFARHRVPAIGFVNESKLAAGDAVDPARVALLRRWTAAGLELGNHTYSHPDLHVLPLDAFQADVIRGEVVTKPIVAEAGRQLRFFRHPFLHTGRSADTRTAFETFLRGRGYRVAPVTIDNADYVFAAAYDRRMAAGDTAAGDRVLEAYLDYMTRVVAYYEQQAQALLGRPMRHILLTHANALNARALPRWLPLLEGRGYRFITLERALEDEAFTARRDAYFGPAGITWLHRWAITEGKGSDFFAGEPNVPEWVAASSGDLAIW